MRSHGWSGDTPASDEEAIARILAAVDTMVAHAETVRIADVARVLGVTRQTVYRYFPNTDAIRSALAVRSADGFLDQLADRVAELHDPVSAMVEALAFSVETIAADDHLRILVTGRDLSGKPTVAVTTETARAFGRSMLRRFEVDWLAWGFDEEGLDELAEFGLRLLLSFLLDDGPGAHRDAELRRFIRRWVGPAVAYPLLAAAFEPLTGPLKAHAAQK